MTPADPLRQWLINNAAWVYTRFDWHDEGQFPTAVDWEVGSTRFQLRVTTVQGNAGRTGSMKPGLIPGDIQLKVADPRITMFLGTRLLPTIVTTPSGDRWSFEATPWALIMKLGLAPQAVTHTLAQTIEAHVEQVLGTILMSVV